MRGNTVKNKYINKVIAIVIICLGWEIASILARQGGSTVASLVPSWYQIITVDFPGFASFKTGGISNDISNYWVALEVLFINSLITIKRVLIGLFLGGFTGILMGILIGLQPTLRKIFYPVIQVIRNIPLLALIGLFLVWFGGKEEGIIIYIAFGLWVIFCTNTIEAIQGINPTSINFAKTLGADNRTISTQIIIPMIIPNLVNALNVAFGIAWAVALGGEFLAAPDGLGKLLIISQDYVQTGRMLIILIIFVFLTELFSWINKKVGTRLTNWMPSNN